MTEYNIPGRKKPTVRCSILFKIPIQTWPCFNYFKTSESYYNIIFTEQIIHYETIKYVDVKKNTELIVTVDYV